MHDAFIYLFVYLYLFIYLYLVIYLLTSLFVYPGTSSWLATASLNRTSVLLSPQK